MSAYSDDLLGLLQRLLITRQSVPDSGIYTFLNPYSYSVLRRDPRDLADFDGLYCDGWLLKRLLGAVFGVAIERVSFDSTSLAPLVFERLVSSGRTVYLIGGSGEEIEGAVVVFRERYPDLNLMGYRDGYFSEPLEMERMIGWVYRNSPACVIAGMGAGLQESFLAGLKRIGWQGLGFTCGGYLKQTARRGLQYYPEVFDRWNMRWLYRLGDEPRLARRYTLGYTKFLWEFARDTRRFRMNQGRERG